MILRVIGLSLLLLAATLTAAITAERLQSPGLTTQQVVDKATRQPTRPHPGPGLSLSFDSTHSLWQWGYGQTLTPGCQKFHINVDGVKASADPLVQIYLETYVIDEQCADKQVFANISGRIGHDANTQFQVFVDGKLVADSSKN